MAHSRVNRSGRFCWRLLLVGLSPCLLIAPREQGSARAEEAAPATKPADAPAIDFARQIQPILAKHCYQCHGPDKHEGGLRLNKREPALAELDSGQHAIVPGDVENSELLRRIISTDGDERMPPEGKPLSAEDVLRLRQWIATGAAWQEHWAFRPLVPQAPPAVKNQAWVRNPIDAFVLAKLEGKSMQPAAPAEPAALLRRVYYDLTGLPPPPAEVQTFIADSSPESYDRVVDRLLASPRHGEHWARHWLDLVRFAETNSFERDGPKPEAWRFRDYVIRSFNDDKPYDQFVREQLAGDELPETTSDSIIATGYYRLGPWDDEPADRVQAEADEFDDIVATTSQVFLGLTINCARCHDHKIDPIPQTDYYRMRAFFGDVRSYVSHYENVPCHQADISAPEVAEQYKTHSARLSDLQRKLSEIEKLGIVKMSAEDQRATEGPERAGVLAAKLKDNLSGDEWQAYQASKGNLKTEEGVKLPPRQMALGVSGCMPFPPKTHVMLRGNAHVLGDSVEPGFPELYGQKLPVLPVPSAFDKTAGRRKLLADWIVSPDNMLGTRVIVNRVWQHHFGRGLVRSTNNFGQLGDAPTHPELLDWLAAELPKQGWRLKALHKLIVTSSTYRMSCKADEQSLRGDPTNDLLSHFDMRRLGAEEVRDSVLALGGQLNLKMFGPGVYPEMSPEVLAGQSIPGSGWGKSAPEEQARRGIYIFVKRSLITPLLSAFDFPETDSSCAGRFYTTQPAQALAMINGDFAGAQAELFAARLRREAGGEVDAQVRLALQLALCREPDSASLERGLKLIESLKQKHGLSAETALRYFCLTVMSLNEFVYLD